MNVDGACNPNSITGSLGCIIKDDAGYLIGGESRFTLRSSPSEVDSEATLMATLLKQGILIALSLSWIPKK
ncbi:hypothetical protein GBA52_010697 [Prunus armeniaca]|nr:hypothetical protein GBA52_028684 [Prunus armeniaca]KAH0983520.1 hypothetical protein GBA52_010697 [Prunus armeniaca]